MILSIVLIIALVRLFSVTPKLDELVVSGFRLLKNKLFPNNALASYFNTTANRQKWFNNLEDDWKILFKFQIQDFNELISDEAITTLFDKKEIEINLDGYKNLSGLRNLTNLKKLTIHNYSNTDLSELIQLTNLKGLKIYHTNFSNGIPIEAFKNITHLALHNCQIDNLDDLCDLPNLVGLALDDNNISNIYSLKRLPSLIYISLCNNPIKDFKDLKRLPNAEIILDVNQKYNLLELNQYGLNIKVYDMNYKTHELN